MIAKYSTLAVKKYGSGAIGTKRQTLFGRQYQAKQHADRQTEMHIFFLLLLWYNALTLQLVLVPLQYSEVQCSTTERPELQCHRNVYIGLGAAVVHDLIPLGGGVHQLPLAVILGVVMLNILRGHNPGNYITRLERFVKHGFCLKGKPWAPIQEAR